MIQTETNSFFYYYVPAKQQFACGKNLLKAKLYFQEYSIDLLTSRRSLDGIDQFHRELESRTFSDYSQTLKVDIAYYELGHFYTKSQVELSPSTPLALSVEFLSAELINFDDGPSLKLDDDFCISKEAYGEQFEKIQSHLERGDCYQVNLTSLISKKFDVTYKPIDFVRSLFRQSNKIGPYAHALYLKEWGKLILSNSPECLFQKKNADTIYSMPIKGTIKKEDNLDISFKNLLNSNKDKAELYMISDLIRNDLSKIDKPLSKIIKSRAPLEVNGLVHQYSLIECKISRDITLKRIFECLFPGGSITGAPKKRVMQIIAQTELTPRGVYCGSTMIHYGSQLAASINIRTSEVNLDLGTLSYGSGGGITLKSQKYDEYNEKLHKILSFFDSFLTQDFR